MSNVTIVDASGNNYVCAFNSTSRRITSITAAGRAWEYEYVDDDPSYTVKEIAPDGSWVSVTVQRHDVVIGSQPVVVRTCVDGNCTEEVMLQPIIGESYVITAKEADGYLSGGHEWETREYDAEGLMTQVNEGGVISEVTEIRQDSLLIRQLSIGGEFGRTFVFSPRGLVTRLHGDEETRMTYNSMLQRMSIADGLDHTTSINFNEAGYMTSRVFPNGGVISYEFDANHNVIQMTTPDGEWNYTYNQHNMLIVCIVPQIGRAHV